MQRNYFDELSTEIKLHIFSVLSDRDVCNVLQLNKHNHTLDSEFLWRWRAKQTQQMLLPAEGDAKTNYKKLNNWELASKNGEVLGSSRIAGCQYFQMILFKKPAPPQQQDEEIANLNNGSYGGYIC